MGTSPQAAETKSAGASQVGEGEGEMLDSRAGGLPGGGKGSQSPRVPSSLTSPILPKMPLVLCPPVSGPGYFGPWLSGSLSA